MKQISLGNGLYALVDDEDFDFLNQWKWHLCKGYASRVVPTGGCPRQSRVYMHRIINNTPENMETDHINRLRFDNRKVNLRNCNRVQNIQNRDIAGINLDRGKWRARIQLSGKRINLGRFETECEAKAAHVAATTANLGDFAPRKGTL